MCMCLRERVGWTFCLFAADGFTATARGKTVCLYNICRGHRDLLATGYLTSPCLSWHTIKTHSFTHRFGRASPALPHLSPRCFDVTAKCLSPQIICSAGCSVNVLQHLSSCSSWAPPRATQSATAWAIHIQGPQWGSGEPGVASSSSFSFFSGTTEGWAAGRSGWKVLRASYSLQVNSFAQLLDMRAPRESGSQGSNQKHSSRFIGRFPLSEQSHIVSFLLKKTCWRAWKCLKQNVRKKIIMT